MGILAAAKRFLSAVVAGLSAVFRGAGSATKPSKVPRCSPGSRKQFGKMPTSRFARRRRAEY